MMLPEADLDYIVHQNLSMWEGFRNQRLFITGGTGFFGQWLMESFATANKILNLKANAVVLTRNAKSAEIKFAHLCADNTISFYEGDVQAFAYPEGDFTYIIHGAADSSLKNEPGFLYGSIVKGTEHMLEFAKTMKELKGFLFISSGAVYGKHSSKTCLSEDTAFAEITNTGYKSEYAPAKRASEALCLQYYQDVSLPIKIARCFSVVGPGLPLDAQFSIGNFIRDGLQGLPITVHGDGTALRSWIYAADLAIWLWTILLRGESMRPYNVGSDKSLSIRELAHLVAHSFGLSPSDVIVKQQFAGGEIDSYVPDIERANNELGLISGKDLDEAINSTTSWYKNMDSYGKN